MTVLNHILVSSLPLATLETEGARDVHRQEDQNEWINVGMDIMYTSHCSHC